MTVQESMLDKNAELPRVATGQVWLACRARRGRTHEQTDTHALLSPICYVAERRSSPESPPLPQETGNCRTPRSTHSIILSQPILAQKRR